MAHLRTSIKLALAFLVAGLLLMESARTSWAQWVEEPGTGWVQVSVFYQNTRQQFNTEGSVERIFDHGHAISSAVFVTGAAGIYRGLDTWVQVPFQFLQFNDILANRDTSGFGEPKIYLRGSPELLGGPELPLAIRGGIKFPRQLTLNAELIPLGTGQRDWELMLEFGHSFYPTPIYLQGWVGYRWREMNATTMRKPGNERFAYLAAGGSYRSFSWKVAVDGFIGNPWRDANFGVVLSNSSQSYLQIFPKIGWQSPLGTVEGGVRIPVAGTNMLYGPVLSFGYFTTWP